MAGNVNAVFLQGRLTQDPELRYTPGGTAVCDLNIAVNRYYRDKNDERQEETLFAPVTVWQKQAENCSEYLSKGSQVIIEGRLKMDQWETDEGQKRSRLKVVARNVQFLSGNGQNARQKAPSGQKSAQPAQGSQPAGNSSGQGNKNDDDFEDIPF